MIFDSARSKVGIDKEIYKLKIRNKSIIKHAIIVPVKL